MRTKKLLYLSRRDIEDIDLPMDDIVEVLDRVFREKGEGKLEMPPKPGINPREDSSMRAMLAYIPSLDAAGVKWISGYGRNYIAGLPNINGLIILNDPETGFPKAVLDCTWITAKRTGASTAVSAKYLARKESKSLGLIACGRLARANLEALMTIFKLERVVAYDIDSAHARAFAEESNERYGVEVEVVHSVRRATEELDLVVTSGPIIAKPKPSIEAAWIAPGAFCCALDFDAYFKTEAFSQANLLVTDDIPQFLYFKGSGYFRNTPIPQTDLGTLIVRPKKLRRMKTARNIAINLGIGILDVAVAQLVYQRASELAIGTELPF